MKYKLSEKFIKSKCFNEYLQYMKNMDQSDEEIIAEIENAIYNSFSRWCKPGFQHDWLTGSKSNHLFYRDFNSLINDANIDDSIYLLWFDINKLRNFHDYYGHHITDEQIKTLSNKLIGIYGKDNVYRYGGEEFIILSKEKIKIKKNIRIEYNHQEIIKSDNPIYKWILTIKQIYLKITIKKSIPTNPYVINEKIQTLIEIEIEEGVKKIKENFCQIEMFI
jgi:diguanylate cyclase (GGDEF)-like protein